MLRIKVPRNSKMLKHQFWQTSKLQKKQFCENYAKVEHALIALTKTLFYYLKT